MASKSTMTLGSIAKKSSGFREREEVSKVSNSCQYKRPIGEYAERPNR